MRKRSQILNKKDALEKLLYSVKNIEHKVRATGSITEAMEKQLLALKEEKKILDEKMADNRERLAAVMNYIEKAKGAKVRVDGNLYKGSVICIDQCRMPVENNTVYMEYRNISGMIAGSVIIKN